MKFFIPAAQDEAQAESVYGAIKLFLSEQLGAEFADERIHSIRYTHEGRTYDDVVGRPNSRNGEPVIAILYEPARSLYHVCTENRGVARGQSILVGGHTVESLVRFD